MPVKMFEGKRSFSFDLYSTYHIFQHGGAFWKSWGVKSEMAAAEQVFVYNFGSSAS